MNVLALVAYLSVGAIPHYMWCPGILQKVEAEREYSDTTKALGSWLFGFFWIAAWPLYFTLVAILVVVELIKNLEGKR